MTNKQLEALGVVLDMLNENGIPTEKTSEALTTFYFLEELKNEQSYICENCNTVQKATVTKACKNCQASGQLQAWSE